MNAIAIGTLLCAVLTQAQRDHEDFAAKVRLQCERFAAVRHSADTAFAQGRDNGEWNKVRDQMTTNLDHAWTAFSDAARDAWPYPVNEERAAAAISALREAQRITSDEYPAGRIGRDATVKLWLTIADKYPGTLEHDAALFDAAMLYLQSYGRKDFKLDLPAARKLLGRLLQRPGPPSCWTLRAEETLVGFSNSPDDRLEARSRLLSTLSQFEDPNRLADAVLVPQPESSPEQMLKRVDEVLTHLDAIRENTAINVVGDARMTENAYASLRELAADHEGDEFVETAIRFGRDAPDLSLGWQGLLFRWTLGAVAFFGPIFVIRWLMTGRSSRGNA